MPTEIIPTNLPEHQVKHWFGSILKTGLIFTCGVITGAVIESMLNDQQTLEQDKDDDNNNRETEASVVDHENEYVDEKAAITTDPEATMAGDSMRENVHQVSTSTIPKEDEEI